MCSFNKKNNVVFFNNVASCIIIKQNKNRKKDSCIIVDYSKSNLKKISFYVYSIIMTSILLLTNYPYRYLLLLILDVKEVNVLDCPQMIAYAVTNFCLSHKSVTQCRISTFILRKMPPFDVI